MRNHSHDRDCSLNSDDVCTECGTHHGEPCPVCGGRGFHAGGCDGQAIRHVEAGEFVWIPAWKVHGMVVDVEPARHGSDDARRLNIQEDIDGPTRWYHMEPADYAVEG